MSSQVIDFHGYVETTEHALRLVLAARQGIIPRVHRRLSEPERRSMIKSGAVFIFSSTESGIKRWTDGFLWSPSRIVGNFLVYREIVERAGARRRCSGTTDSASSTSSQSSSDSPTLPSRSVLDHGVLKPGGLIKKTITVVLDDQDHHLVAYYTQADLDGGKLLKPSAHHQIMSLQLPPHIFRLNSFRIPPKVSIGKDGNPYLVPESESDSIPSLKYLSSSTISAHKIKLEPECSQIPRSPSTSTVSSDASSSIPPSPRPSDQVVPSSRNVPHHGVYGGIPSHYGTGSMALPSLSPSVTPIPSRRVYNRDRTAALDGSSCNNRWSDMLLPPPSNHPSPPRRHRYPDNGSSGILSYDYQPNVGAPLPDHVRAGSSSEVAGYRLITSRYTLAPDVAPLHWTEGHNSAEPPPLTPTTASANGSPTDSCYPQSIYHPTPSYNSTHANMFHSNLRQDETSPSPSPYGSSNYGPRTYSSVSSHTADPLHSPTHGFNFEFNSSYPT